MRMLVLALLSGAVASASCPALACDYSIGTQPPSFPSWAGEISGTATHPTNGLFVTSAGDAPWIGADGRTIDFVNDSSVTAMLAPLGATVGRARGGLRPNETLRNDPCPGCPVILRVGSGPDTSPPAVATISDFRALLVRNPSMWNNCPADHDVLSFRVEAHDDLTAPGDMLLLVFVEADEQAARTTPIPRSIRGLEENELGWRVEENLGLSQDREENAPFGFAGRFCMTAALMDQAGNVGPRSEAFCVEPRDPDDPAIVFVASRGGTSGCGTGAGAGAPSLAIACLAFVRRRRLGRARRG